MTLPTLRALMIGNALEYYDFFLYSFFVSILSPLFFPASDPLTGLMMGFSVFAVGYISRPIGALVFGHWGDKFGRKKALFGTLLLMAFSTVGIGFLPTYETIGIFSPIFLVFFRLLQGLATGGEINGAAVFGLEQTHPAKRGFVGSLIKSSAGIGAILATTMGAIFTNEFMPEWAWRIPFCLGGLVAVVGLYLRRVLEESEQRKTVRIPLLDIIQNHPLSFLKTIGIGSFLHVPYYVIVGYMNSTLYAKDLVSGFELMLMNTAVTLIGTIAIPVMGHFSDKVGHDRLMIWGALGQTLLIFPVFFIYTQENILGILCSQMVLLFFAEAFVAPASAYMNTLFPRECRYSGVAIGDCLGIAIFGGTTPLICNQLAKFIDPLWGPCLYIIGMAFLGIIAVGSRKEKRFTIFAT